jgi:hypothetical protein
LTQREDRTNLEMKTVFKLLRAIWLVVPLAIATLASPAAALGFSPPLMLFAYDGQNRASSPYDGAVLAGSGYDLGAVSTAIGEANQTAGTSNLFSRSAEFLAAEGTANAYNTIGSTGKIGEQWLAQNLGGESQVFFNTSQGARYVDQFAGGIANESKVGYQSLTPSIHLQISKDAELLNAGRRTGPQNSDQWLS